MATKLYFKDGSAKTEIPFLPSQSGNAGKFLKTDGTDASWAAASAPYVLQEEIADGAIKTWTLDSFASLQVYLDGLLCLAGTNYSVSGTTVTFVTTPPANTRISFFKYNGLNTGSLPIATTTSTGVVKAGGGLNVDAAGSLSLKNIVRESISVDTAGSAFNVTATFRDLLVFLDGLLCDPTTNYTVSGQTVTFTETIPVGSSITFIAFP